MVMNKESGTDQKIVLKLYAAFGAAIALSMVPMIAAAVITAILYPGVLIAAYLVRRRSTEGSLTENHATYIIRTMWLTGLLTLVTMVAAAFYLLQTVDNAPLESCINGVVSLGEKAQEASFRELSNLLQPCLDQYLHFNARPFLISFVLAAGPVLLYLIVRFTRGLVRAAAGYRLAHVRSWF